MRITIIGDGKLGSTLTEHLSSEGHDVTVIDHQGSVLNHSVNMHDVIGIQGNGASYDVQIEVGVPKSDLVIAATSSDELNILCCITGKKLGAKNTIARVRNPEYAKQLQMMRDELGLSMVVNPEREAAREIARNLRFPSAINIDLFARGRVELVEFRITKDSPIANKTLSQIGSLYKEKFLVCAVNRENEVYIPTGNFVLHEGDRVHVTASAADISSLFTSLGIVQQKVRKVMILGGGRISLYLTRQLTEMGIDVTILEKDAERCQILCEYLPKATIIYGDGTDRELLNEESIGEMDAFVALTGLDEQNIIVSMYAVSCGVQKVLTKIDHILFPEIFSNAGIESVISPIRTAANQIIRFVRAMQNSLSSSNIETLHKLVGNRVEALEFLVKQKAEYVDVPLRKLEIRDNTLIACILRNGMTIIPGGNDVIKLNDRVIVAAKNGNIQDLRDILK